MPYKWMQTIGDLDLTFSVPGNYKSKDLTIDLQKTKILAGVKGQKPLIAVRATACRLPSAPLPLPFLPSSKN